MQKISAFGALLSLLITYKTKKKLPNPQRLISPQKHLVNKFLHLGKCEAVIDEEHK
jgi:hypothetical protein